MEAHKEPRKEERLPRHADLFKAVNNDLSYAVGELESLRNRISGSDEPEGTDETSSPVPPPADVYVNVPGEIRDFSKRIHSSVNEIRDMVA